MVSTGFENIIYDINNTLRHCFRQQAARCNEYCIFIDRMKIKYPDSDLSLTSVQPSDLHFVPSGGWHSVEKHVEDKALDDFSQIDKNTFAVKYGRMLEAKKLFERLGGIYENY